MLVKEARQDAEKRKLSDSYHPTNTQTIGPIIAGGNVNIEQAISNNPQLKEWDNNFFNGPVGLTIIAGVGGLLTLVLAQWLGVPH